MKRIREAFTVTTTMLIVAVIACIPFPAAAGPVAGVLALCSGGLGLALVRTNQRIVALILVGVGSAALLGAVAVGGRIEGAALLVLNQDVIGMLAAVAFLGAITAPPGGPTHRLMGAPAVWRTAAVLHFLGAVINVAAITIVGDRLRTVASLGTAHAVLISRSFATAAFWSPFWVGSAAASTFAPGADLLVVTGTGFVLACATAAITMPGLLREFRPHLTGYGGYPLNWRLMRIPLVLVAAVSALHLLMPTVPVPRLVAASAVTAFLIVMGWRNGPHSPRRIGGEAGRVLLTMRGEVTLFVAAGVLAIGVGALLVALDLRLPLTGFTVPVAWTCTAGMTLLSLLGLHPLVTIGVVAALVAPLEPDPSLFMTAALVAWGLGAAAGPISGIQMLLQGRYGAEPLTTTKKNLPFLMGGLLLAGPALWAVETLVAVT